MPVLEEALDAAHKGAGFAWNRGREYQHGGWPAWMAFCCASEYGNAFGSGGVWGAGGVIAANRDTCFDAGSLEGAALGFLPGFWASGQSIQQG